VPVPFNGAINKSTVNLDPRQLAEADKEKAAKAITGGQRLGEQGQTYRREYKQSAAGPKPAARITT